MFIIGWSVIKMAGYALKLKSKAVNAIIIQHTFYREHDPFPIFPEIAVYVLRSKRIVWSSSAS